MSVSVAVSNKNRVRFIARGMVDFVSRYYTEQKFDVSISDITAEDLYLASKLKTILKNSVSQFKNERYIKAHNHFIEMKDREAHMRKSFTSGLLEIAKEESHNTFLHECTLYIIQAHELERLGFEEAIDIVADAIYLACINSDQQIHLVKWDTQAEGRNNSENNDTDDCTGLNNNSERNGDGLQQSSEGELYIDVGIYEDAQFSKSDFDHSDGLETSETNGSHANQLTKKISPPKTPIMNSSEIPKNGTTAEHSPPKCEPSGSDTFHVAKQNSSPKKRKRKNSGEIHKKGPTVHHTPPNSKSNGSHTDQVTSQSCRPPKKRILKSAEVQKESTAVIHPDSTSASRKKRKQVTPRRSDTSEVSKE